MLKDDMKSRLQPNWMQVPLPPLLEGMYHNKMPKDGPPLLVSFSEFRMALHKLAYKAPGTDGVTAHAMKLLPLEMQVILWRLINACFKGGRVPWKLALAKIILLIRKATTPSLKTGALSHS